jgi:hypothetical protein
LVKIGPRYFESWCFVELKKYITGQQVAEGFCMPWGWGISRYCMMSDRRIVHPIPLNYIISFGWWLYYKLGKPWFVEETFRLQVEHEKYRSKWWADGWKAGWEDCKNKEHWGQWEHLYRGEWGRETVEERIEEAMKESAEEIAVETIRRLVNE